MEEGIEYLCDINSIYSFDVIDRCEMVRRYCMEDDLWFNLVEIHFCQMKEYTHITAPLSIVLIMVMFSVIGDVCEDYMVSGVVKIIKKMNINEAIAGKTILPIVNACGDMITVIIAANSRDDLDLALGALFGANLFTSCLVFSTIIYLSRSNLPMDISSSKIYIDIIFYLCGCISLALCCHFGMDFLPFSFILLSMFVVYIIIAVNLTKFNPVLIDPEDVYENRAFEIMNNAERVGDLKEELDKELQGNNERMIGRNKLNRNIRTSRENRK